METVWTVLTYLLVLHLVKGSITNVAKNKPASMSSNYGSFNPARAVDGNTTAVYPGGVIHTAHGQPSAWWKVDLERDVQDAIVEIYFRVDYKARRNGVKISTSTTPFSSYPEGQLCYTVTGDPNGSDIDDVVSVTCTGRWRYILVYTNTDNGGLSNGPVLDFGEVMVLVCSDGTYGENCIKTCNTRHCVTMTTTCERDGRCPGGCKTGWTGVDCTQVCDSNFYGSGCSLLCSNRKCLNPASSCDHVTGLCVGGCQPGYKGTNCVQMCSPGTYGSRCSQLCSDRHCLNSSASCDHTSGSCDGDCRSGWRGTDCTQVCQTGMYGVNCMKSCSSRHCVTSSSECDRQTGQCIGGCQEGWRGVDCAQECPAGTFGVRCTSCSTRHCQGDSDCPADGRCSQRCQDGWTLNTCTQECSNGTYGVNCMKSCSSRHCVTPSSVCDRQTGQCIGGCQEGWRGVDCTEECPSGSYGPGCNKMCGHCIGDTICNHATGNCPGDCQDGWDGRQCQQVSEGGYPLSTVVGAVVGSVLVVVLVGVGIHLCLIRQGRLQWVKVTNKDKSNQNTGYNTQMRNLGEEHVSGAEHAHSSCAYNNDYAELNAETQTGNKDYDVIQQKHYQNV